MWSFAEKIAVHWLAFENSERQFPPLQLEVLLVGRKRHGNSTKIHVACSDD